MADPPRITESESRRRKLVWEAVLGFVTTFATLAGVVAVWNVFRPDPSVGPALVFAVLLALVWLTWRQYGRYR
ncbi:hypothetical protein [Corynebacterium heidelbergense]|uniref:Uncharacterized protein n=1 Tax=Corynebacterium heidelbergense TaxID=2055947 RepID=A0A364VDT5_9CORY|nr:hypothetical protein [Corynebacterium heidelbergense]RAV34809.1 hypothetical protein CWC39_01365 [Corynebacterium heidelbergense]WCZ37216.1 hypothetical protein CHEID_08430 [Corynebacterium heidelbergense]